MVLQPHIAWAIVDYVYQSYNLTLIVYKPADLCTLKSRTRTLGRILQVCKAFYHPATRHLYSSLSVDLAGGEDPRSNSLLGPLTDTGNKTTLLLFTKHLRIGRHTTKECGALASYGGSITLPNLQTLVIDTTQTCDEVDSCYANVCGLTSKLKPTDKLLLVADAEAFSPAEWPISDLTNAIARLSTAVSTVEVQLGLAGVLWLPKLLGVKYGPSVTKLVFVVETDGPSDYAHFIRCAEDDAFQQASRCLLARLRDPNNQVQFITVVIRLSGTGTGTGPSADWFLLKTQVYKLIWAGALSEFSMGTRSRMVLDM